MLLRLVMICMNLLVGYRLCVMLSDVHVTSGYRCRQHDANVGTSSRPGAGPHRTGIAADIVDGMSADDLAKYCEDAGFRGIEVYRKKGFVHVDVRSTLPEIWYE